MEVYGGLVMKCLIPITQEMKNENAVKRVPVLCDDIHLLYVLDRKMLDRMESESSYVLDSETLKSLESTIIESQKKEAESILKSLGIPTKKASLNFEVGEYFETLEKYALKLMPDIIMVDSFERRLLSLNVPLWIDAGNDIKRCVFVVQSVAKIKRLRRDFEFMEAICQKIHCDMKIFYRSDERGAAKTLEGLAPITTSTEGDMLCLQSFDHKYVKKAATVVVFYS